MKNGTSNIRSQLLSRYFEEDTPKKQNRSTDVNVLLNRVKNNPLDQINYALNNFSENLLNVFLGSIEKVEANMPRKKIDLVLCNILAPVIKLIGPGFEKIIAHKGKVILSGLLVEQIEELQEFFLPLGWQVLEIKIKDQWALMVLTLDVT